MVKQRMSTADVAGEVACLRQRVMGMRLANLYDVNTKVGPHHSPVHPAWCAASTARVQAAEVGCPECHMQTYIMKLARSGEDGEKVHIVLESGVRFHTTQVQSWMVSAL